MATNLALARLCISCSHAGTCMYLRANSVGAWQCDLYQAAPSDQPSPVLPDLRGPSTLSHFQSTNSPVATGSSYGLCVNCDVRTTCSLPRAPGGVWRCEEYV